MHPSVPLLLRMMSSSVVLSCHKPNHPNTQSARKQKQKMQRQQREDVLQLLKKKQQLEQQLQTEERRDNLPPVPLFDSAASRAQKNAEEEQVVVATAVINQLIEKKDTLEEQLSAVQQSTDQQSVHQETLESLKAAQSQLASLQQQLVASQQQQRSTSEQHEQAKTAQTTQLDSITTELTQTITRLTSTQQQLLAIQQSTVPVDTHNAAIDELNSKLASLNQQLTEQRKAVSKLTKKLREVEAALESSEGQLSNNDAAADTERAALLTRVKQLQTEVAQIREELRIALDRLAATVSFTTHQETVDALAAAQSELRTLRQHLANSSSSHDNSLASLAAQTAAEIARLRTDITTQQQRSTELTSERDTLLTALKVRSDELDMLVREKADLFFLKQQLDERILSLNAQVAAHSDTIQQLQAAQLQSADEKAALGDELYRALQHYQRLEADKQLVDDDVLALKTSSQAAVQAAEDEVDRLRAELDSEKQGEAERDTRMTKLQTQHDRTAQALKDMETAVSGYMEDVKLAEKEVREVRQQLSDKQEELATLQQHFVAQREQHMDGSQHRGEEEEDEHDALNESLVMLESAIKQSVAHREQAVDAQGTAGATDATPLRPRRFMFVDVKAAAASSSSEQPATPKQHKRVSSTRAPLSPRSIASPASPRSMGTTHNFTGTATPTAVATSATSSNDVSAAALVEAQSQVTSLKTNIEQLRGELKVKDDALAESQRSVQHAQTTIDRLRRHAQGKRDSASFTLSSLHASQLRMEELNQRITAKMQQHYHNRQPSQPNNVAGSGDSKTEAHARTQSAPSAASMAGVSAEVSRLLAQLSAEQSKVMEQAQALTALRTQQQTEAVYHSTLVQRLEDAEGDCKKLRLKLHTKQKETEGIHQIIEQAGGELAKVVEESNERAAAIDQLAGEVKEWKGRWDELQAKVDSWSESEHKAWHASGGDKKETKKEYLKRRWHELTYGGHRHCASCERAAAEREKEKGDHQHEPHSASVHGHKTPARGKQHSRKESASHNKRQDQLQVPGAAHHRSLSDDEDHLEDAHSRHHGHHRTDSQGSVDGEQLDQTLTHSHDHSHAAIDTTASDIDHCLHSCKQIIDKIKHTTAEDNNGNTEVQSDLSTLQHHIIQLAAHIKALLSTQMARPDLSLILPTFEQSMGSPISLRSAGSAEVVPHHVVEAERRVQVVEREKQRLQAELRDERRAMETMEAELLALKEENLARRQDDEEVHTRLQQVKQLVHYQHSRKPSSVTSVGSYSSASSGVSSAFAEEQKEIEEGWALDEQEALIKQLIVQSSTAQREIEQLQVLRREDEERINLAVQELRNSRERVMHDYADMVLLNKQLSDQHTQIEQLTDAIRLKDNTIAQLQADVQQLREQHEADVAAANLSLRDESTANPLTLSMVDNGLALYQQAVDEKEAELKDVKSLVSAQEATVAKLTKENKELRQRLQLAASGSREASNDSSEALVALGELSKEYRAERRLREKLQQDSQLQIMTPAASPIHSRQHSAAASTTASAASSPRNTAALITPNRLSRELTWWQQHRRRSSGTLPLTGAFSTPAAGVRSALAGAFVSEPVGTFNTPAKPRSGLHSRQDSATAATARVVEEKTINPHGTTQ